MSDSSTGGMSRGAGGVAAARHERPGTGPAPAGHDAEPALVHAAGPHPFWGGRPQPLHVTIERAAGEVFDLLLSLGASPDGENDGYDGWSPLMLAASAGRTRMRETLLARGARIGVVEALLLADDARLERLLAAGAAALPARGPAPARC